MATRLCGQAYLVSLDRAKGQRAILIQTSAGNVLWDLIAYLDDATIQWVAYRSKIESLGGLQAIVISHPHFYTTYAEWSRTFECPIYTSEDDKMWLDRLEAPGAERRFVKGSTSEILEGVTAVKTGGHFDGSLVLHWDDKLFIADTLLTVP
ncbi:MAG: hypothetical protein M1830_004153, partial [Pleopsidium flavum]